MVTQPSIEGNLDCRARPFHSELCFDTATFRLHPKLRDSFHLLRNDFTATRCPLRNQGLAEKMALRCEMISQPHSYPLRKFLQLRNTPSTHECHFATPHSHFAAAKWPAKMPLGCKYGLWLRNHLWASKWLRNDLQAVKSPPGFEIDLQNGGRFAKTPCKAKGSYKNANRASRPCI